MRAGSDNQMEIETLNVVSLFGGQTLIQEALITDPMEALLEEAMTPDTLEEEVILATPRKVVSENQFPDQSMYVLSEQLKTLRTQLKRINFYLDDVEDLIPARNR